MAVENITILTSDTKISLKEESISAKEKKKKKRQYPPLPGSDVITLGENELLLLQEEGKEFMFLGGGRRERVIQFQLGDSGLLL